MKLFPFLLLFCCPLFAFAESITTIPEVKLHNRPSRMIKQDASMQTTHFTREEIKTSPVTNLSQLFKREQSVIRVVKGINGNEAALSIRGFGDNAASNSLILVDGFPLINVSMQSPDFNAIALSDIERIDIVQGSQGSLFGDQAVGGVVNIITRHPEKWLGDLNLGLGNFGQQFYQALAANKFSNGIFFKAYGFSSRNNHDRDYQLQKSATGFLQAGKDYARGTFRFSFQTSDQTSQLPGSLTQAQFDANPHQANNHQNFNHRQTTILQLLNKHEITSDWVLETRLWHQQINGNGWIGSTYANHEWINALNPQLVGSVANNKLIVGVMAQNNHYQFDNALFHERVSAQQKHLYSQITVPLSDKIDFTFGGRLAVQNNNVQGNHFTNRVFVTEQGISFRPSDSWQFYARRDGNFRLPKANEETWLPDSVYRLQPQTGVSYEAGMIYRSDRQKAQLNLYRLQLNNEIAFDPTESIFNPFGSFQNFSSTIRNGITLTEYFKITPKLSFDGQFNYVQARFDSGLFSGKLIPAVPAMNANAGLDYDFMENWRAKYSVVYTGSRFASLDVENTGRKQGSYWLNIFAIQYIRKTFDVSLELNNLFNQKYAAYTAFDAPSQSYRYYPGEGRSVLLTFKANLE